MGSLQPWTLVRTFVRQTGGASGGEWGGRQGGGKQSCEHVGFSSWRLELWILEPEEWRGLHSTWKNVRHEQGEIANSVVNYRTIGQVTPANR